VGEYSGAPDLILYCPTDTKEYTRNRTQTLIFKGFQYP
jgi:hypothetical protein